ncbi:Putative membrane protein [Amycolatopsis japonica]|uniref:Putative membrane protein n=1 Tax=Amycolatopsis japonica TaxID=208439 RepID=A0A075UP68_9PSEU|nr:Putative membrane protein [Amycolatopsis japonica]
MTHSDRLPAHSAITQRNISGSVGDVERTYFGVRLKLMLALFLPELFVVLPVVGGINPLSLATALTASVAVANPLGLAAALTASLAAVLLALAVHFRLEPAAAAMRVRAISLRERAQLFLSLRDPDARGRVRPRAPSPGIVTA